MVDVCRVPDGVLRDLGGAGDVDGGSGGSLPADLGDRVGSKSCTSNLREKMTIIIWLVGPILHLRSSEITEDAVRHTADVYHFLTYSGPVR